MGAPLPARDGAAPCRHHDQTVSVMLVDDSIVARSILERIICDDAGFSIAASVPTAGDALDLLAQLTPDIIILDIEMPGMNGLAALPLMLARSPASRIFILSANCDDGGPAAIQALTLGAADTLVKPGRGSFAGAFATTLMARLRSLTEATCEERAIAVRAMLQPAPVLQPVPAQPIDAIGIGASTGGIVAINGFLTALADEVRCPIFITQHLPDTFIPYFAEQLKRIVRRDVVVADHGQTVCENTVYIAPGVGHIQLVRVRDQVCIEIARHRVANGAMPSVDPMMASIAEVYGSRACGIMLSGMGRDGLDGVTALRRAGALIAAQSPGSSVVWGMPGSVAKVGMAQIIDAPVNLAEAVSRIILNGRNHD